MPSALVDDAVAVSALSHSDAHAPLVAASVQPALLGLTLIAPAVDLLAIVQHGAGVPSLGLVATALGSAVLLVYWARYPRTSWLAAAALASLASVAMRVIGADIAPLLSLMAVVALGIGGAFATPLPEPDARPGGASSAAFFAD